MTQMNINSADLLMASSQILMFAIVAVILSKAADNPEPADSSTFRTKYKFLWSGSVAALAALFIGVILIIATKGNSSIYEKGGIARFYDCTHKLESGYGANALNILAQLVLYLIVIYAMVETQNKFSDTPKKFRERYPIMFWASVAELVIVFLAILRLLFSGEDFSTTSILKTLRIISSCEN